VLDPLAGAATERGYKVATLHRVGHAADEIATIAQRGDFDLIVMGTPATGCSAAWCWGRSLREFSPAPAMPVLLVP
jgi:nucleotide-binding universal stress UspA family protein